MDTLRHWLRSNIPSYLLPDAPCNLFPEQYREGELTWKSNRQGNVLSVEISFALTCPTDRPFQLSHCATSLFVLTPWVGTDFSDNWFISPASAVQDLTGHLQTLLGVKRPNSRVLTMNEISDLPSTIYVHSTAAGDLLILPPQW
jgi:hypothetical protein